MSVHETPMTREYARRRGGLLVEEPTIVPAGSGNGRRFVDGLLYPNLPDGIAGWIDPRVAAEQDVEVLQTKQSQLGGYLFGQSAFSPILLGERKRRGAVRSVAICSSDDGELRPLLESRGVGVVVLDGYRSPREKKSPVRELRERFWRQRGGLLVERFEILSANGPNGRHVAEAILLPNRETRRAERGERIDLTGEDVIAIATNLGLGMYVTGEALAAYELLRKHHRPSSLRSVAVVPRDDTVIRRLYDDLRGIERVVL